MQNSRKAHSGDDPLDQSIVHVAQWVDSVLPKSSTAGENNSISTGENLLAVHRCFDFLERVWPSEIPSRPTAGPFKLEHEIGRGGMGTVWLASQQKPVSRSVAIKLIKTGPHSAHLIRRFESERNNLALMKHPGIATLIDAGETDDGQLYFAMELVEGPNLVDYCDAHRLSVRDRLELFLDVCSAVQHAHQKGIIHRDLKPSNILVSQVDKNPLLKVIDFGLSKFDGATPIRDQGSGVNSQTEHQFTVTQAGQIVGSLGYMSPEQAASDAGNIDTRVDVYSLGIILYKLLTDSKPINKKAFPDASAEEILEAIQCKPVPLPSQQLSEASPKMLAKIIGDRQTSQSALSRTLKQDLDWVVMRAIARKPEDRYQTVSNFAEDIRRFLNHESVSARPDSNWYRLRKTFFRNRLLWSSVACVMLALALGTVLATTGLIRARNAEKVAEAQLAESRRSNAVLAEIFSDIDVYAAELESEPFKVMAARNLATAADRLNESENEASAESIKLQVKIAHALNGLEFFDDALPISRNAYKKASTLKDSFGVELDAGKELVRSLIGKADITQAREALKPLLEKCREQSGPDSESYLDLVFLSGMAAYTEFDHKRASKEFHQVAAGRESILGKNDLQTTEANYWISMCFDSSDTSDSALATMKTVTDQYRKALPEGHPRSIHAMLNYGWALSDTGDFGEGLKFAEEGLQLATQTFGNNHPTTFYGKLTVGLLIHRKGNFKRGTAMVEEAWEGLSNTTGLHHPRTVTAPLMLAQMNERIGNDARVIELLEQALALSQGQRRIETRLANAYAKVGEFEKARATIQSLLDSNAAENDGRRDDNADASLHFYSIGNFYALEENFEKAIEHLRLSRQGFLRSGSLDNFPAMRTTLLLANCLAKTGSHEEAMQVIQDYQSAIPAEKGPNDRLRLCCEAEKGVALRLAGKFEEAIAQFESVAKSGVRLRRTEHLFNEWRMAQVEAGQTREMMQSVERELKSFPRRFSSDSIQMAMQLRTLGYDLVDFKQQDKALELLNQSISMLKELKPKSWTLAITRFDIARLSLDLKFADDSMVQQSLMELDDAWNQLKELEPNAFPIERRALKHSTAKLVLLLESAGDEDSVQLWRDRLENKP